MEREKGKKDVKGRKETRVKRKLRISYANLDITKVSEKISDMKETNNFGK